MTSHPTKSPQHLSTASKAFYRKVIAESNLSPTETVILVQLCEQLDRKSTASAAVRQDGITIQSDSGVLKPHPALSIERQAAHLISQLVRQLDLGRIDLDDEPEVKVDPVPRTRNAKKGRRA